MKAYTLWPQFRIKEKVKEVLRSNSNRQTTNSKPLKSKPTIYIAISFNNKHVVLCFEKKKIGAMFIMKLDPPKVFRLY
jgi:hypothetical protein